MMEEKGINPDVVTYTSIINGYTKNGIMDEARKVLETMQQKGKKGHNSLLWNKCCNFVSPSLLHCNYLLFITELSSRYFLA